MARAVTATLHDADLNPVGNTAVRIAQVVRGRFRVLAAGQTDGEGRLSINWDGAGAVSKAVLQYRKGRQWLTLTAPAIIYGGH